MTTDPSSDPHELFDVYDSAGRPRGTVKRRAEVHRDGDWHRSFHCWVTCLPSNGGILSPAGTETRQGAESRSGAETAPGDAEAPILLLQRRGRHKDTWPGRLDASVGGHYRAGETLGDVIREVEEEIGRAVALEALIPLGHRVSVSESEPGTADRELQDVFLWRAPYPLEAFRPRPVEVTALEAASVAHLLRLFTGQADRVPVRTLLPQGQILPGTITQEDFIPTFDRYFYRVAMLVELASRGYPHLVV
jgi:8-oxo-dGTP pyrophosphatase MutT (NUDIX family)